MKIAQLNIVETSSTGKIMLQLADLSQKKANHDVWIATPVLYGRKKTKKTCVSHYRWGGRFSSLFHRVVGELFGVNGLLSVFGTRKLIKRLMKFSPDVIHLHNIHAFCINVPMLFKYIKKNNIRVIWTLHDGWPFTGHCAYFSYVRCEKWKDGCHHCVQPRAYPKMLLDTSRWMYKKKKQWFTGINDMTIVTPSQWLADLVRQSFLKEYPVRVINNGIDLEVFRPTQSAFREKYNISEGKKILLGVAFGWAKRKGLDVFLEFAKRLDAEKYQIVLVGTNEALDAQLPKNIISIHRTNNQTELAEIYTSADLFVNPTREENYPTVNMEALACGTPVLTFRTGGSPEIVDETCGAVVDCDDIDAMEQEVVRICEGEMYSRESCLQKAKAFDKNKRFEEYIKLYEDSTHPSFGTVH